MDLVHPQYVEVDATNLGARRLLMGAGFRLAHRQQAAAQILTTLGLRNATFVRDDGPGVVYTRHRMMSPDARPMRLLVAGAHDQP